MTQDKIPDTFQKPERRRMLGLRRSALAETLLPIVFLLFIDFFLSDHTRFWAVNPHPFLFIVLFIACKYGTKEALTTTLLCSIALLAGNLPMQSINQDHYAYIFYVIKLPLLWLVCSVVFGGLRLMHIRERDHLETALQEAEDRERQIADSYQKIKELKDQWELRLAGQLRSSIAAYQAAKSMESLSIDQIMRGLEELIYVTMHCEQFSIYMLDGTGLTLTLAHGWPEGDEHLRHFAVQSTLYEAIIVKQKILCVATPEHQRKLIGQGLLAGPLLGKKSGEVLGMIKIEKMAFSDLHLSTIEAFDTICEWATMAILNARKYQASKDGSMINPDHKLFTHNYFKHYIDYMGTLARRGGFDLTMVSIMLNDSDQFDQDTRTQIACVLADSVNSVLRHVDLAFEQQDNSSEYSILLPVTGRDGAEIVLEKIRGTLKARIAEIADQFSFTIKTIYEKPKN